VSGILSVWDFWQGDEAMDDLSKSLLFGVLMAAFLLQIFGHIYGTRFDEHSIDRTAMPVCVESDSFFALVFYS
jgi:hypothetical protein